MKYRRNQPTTQHLFCFLRNNDNKSLPIALVMIFIIFLKFHYRRRHRYLHKITGLGLPPSPPLNAGPWPKNPVLTFTLDSPPTWINYATIFGYPILEHTLSLLCFRVPWFLLDRSLRIVLLRILMLGLPLEGVSSWFALGSKYGIYEIIDAPPCMENGVGWDGIDYRSSNRRSLLPHIISYIGE